MKFQRNTFLLVLVATLLMAGFFVSEVFLEPRKEQSDGGSAASKGGGALFSFEEKDIVAFQVQRPDLTLAFEKREEPPEGESDWLMKQPEAIQASDGAVAFLLNLVATEISQQRVEVGGDRQSEFGFDQPAIVNVTLANGDEHVLVLGNANFDRSAFYALTDTPPNAETLPVQLVTVDFEPAINRPLDEWKYTAEQPPVEPELSDGDEAAPAPETEQDSAGQDAVEAEIASPETETPGPETPETEAETEVENVPTTEPEDPQP